MKMNTNALVRKLSRPIAVHEGEDATMIAEAFERLIADEDPVRDVLVAARWKEVWRIDGGGYFRPPTGPCRSGCPCRGAL